MERRSEGWDPYWGRLLRIDFFDGQWESYRSIADARAKWLVETFNLDPRRRVLSLACGEGGIELALARLGFSVTGIDRNHALIDFARNQAEAEELNAIFLATDLRTSSMLPYDNGLVCCFDTLGLLGRREEARLIAAAAGALASDGLLLVDGPRSEELVNGRNWWPVAGGFVLLDSKYDKDQRVQHMEPLFLADDGQIVDLADSYDSEQPTAKGVTRYVYSADELRSLVATVGLEAHVVEHQRKGYYMIAARPAVRQ